jgi:hypothetical protein
MEQHLQLPKIGELPGLWVSPCCCGWGHCCWALGGSGAQLNTWQGLVLSACWVFVRAGSLVREALYTMVP